MPFIFHYPDRPMITEILPRKTHLPPDPTSLPIPTAIAKLGKEAAWHFLDFFTARIANDHTRRAYHRAVTRFFAWLDSSSIPLGAVRPSHIATYLKELGQTVSIPSVKQTLAAIRMLFDHLVVNHVVQLNPASSVRGPNYSVTCGKTPVLTDEEARQLFASIDASHLVGLRDRALIAVMVYTFARVGAAIGLNVEDYFPQGKRWFIELREKRGKRHCMPAHHKLEEYLDAYIEAASITDE